MKQLFLFAVAGLGLVSASPPPDVESDPRADEGYPPCSRTVRDRCIQLHERGVARRDNLAANERLGPRVPEVEMAEYRPDRPEMGDGIAPGPITAASDQPRAATQPRVVTERRVVTQRRVLAQRVRRAGERG